MTVPSATSRTNEAAERLREWISGIANDSRAVPNRWLDAALSEERRRALASIRGRINRMPRLDASPECVAVADLVKLLDHWEQTVANEPKVAR